MWTAFHKPLGFEGPYHLRCHHRVGARVLGNIALSYRSLRVQPGQCGEQNELHVGQVERPQSRANRGLPSVGDTPQHQPRTIARVLEVGFQFLRHSASVSARCRTQNLDVVVIQRNQATPELIPPIRCRGQRQSTPDCVERNGVELFVPNSPPKRLETPLVRLPDLTLFDHTESCELAQRISVAHGLDRRIIDKHVTCFHPYQTSSLSVPDLCDTEIHCATHMFGRDNP